MGDVEKYANYLLVRFIGKDNPPTGLVVSKAKRESIIACEILIEETGRTFFYRVKTYLEELTNIK